MMTSDQKKRLTVGLGVVAGGLLISLGYLLWSHFSLNIHLAFASEQVGMFEIMRDKALEGDPREAAKCLQYVIDYYPSDTKQPAGSRLDRIVEQAKVHAVREIIAHLRAKTGDDLGDDPALWIQKYAKP